LIFPDSFIQIFPVRKHLPLGIPQQRNMRNLAGTLGDGRRQKRLNFWFENVAIKQQSPKVLKG